MEEKNRRQDLGSYLKGHRKAVGLSQSEVGKKLGYSSPQFVSNFERGNCTPPLKALRTLVRLYHLEAEELISLVMRGNRSRMEREFL